MTDESHRCRSKFSIRGITSESKMQTTVFFVIAFTCCLLTAEAAPPIFQIEMATVTPVTAIDRLVVAETVTAIVTFSTALSGLMDSASTNYATLVTSS